MRIVKTKYRRTFHRLFGILIAFVYTLAVVPHVNPLNVLALGGISEYEYDGFDYYVEWSGSEYGAGVCFYHCEYCGQGFGREFDDSDHEGCIADMLDDDMYECGHCFNCAQDYHCMYCGECFEFGDAEKCDSCNSMLCVNCHLGDYYCDLCGECRLEENGDLEEGAFLHNLDMYLCDDCFEDNVTCTLCGNYISFGGGQYQIYAELGMDWCEEHELCGRCLEDVGCLEGTGHCWDCGACSSEVTFCDECGLCEESYPGFTHCPECDTCFGGEVPMCASGGDHCVLCCEDNDWLCPECGKCVGAEGEELCADCGLCAACCEAASESAGCTHGYCVESAEYEEHLCPECGICPDDTACDYCGRCENCAADYHCIHEICPDNDQEWEEHLCISCGECFDPEELCEYCHMCPECNAHCEHGICPEDYGNDEHIFCDNCGECFEEDEICETCGLCLDCCQAAAWEFGCTHRRCINTAAFREHYCFEDGRCSEYCNHDESCEHLHLSEEFSWDYASHWYVCADCGVSVNAAAHVEEEPVLVAAPDPLTRKNGIARVSCAECGAFIRTVSIPYTDIPTDGTPYIIGQPHDYTGKVSDTMADKPEQTRFHVSAMGSNLTYQWYSYSPKTGKSGLLTDTEDPEVFMQIHGSNSDTLFITVHTDACFEPAGYYCIVSNENGSVQSRTAMERPHHVFNEHSEYVSLSDGTHARVCVGEGCEAHEAHPHPHEYDAWFVYRTATAEHTGIRRQVCKVCGETQDITIPKVEAGHAHAFNQYAAGPTKHWKECVCGLKQKGSEKAHVFDEWATTREPTELKAGQKTRRCKTCGYVEHADIEKLPHTHNFTDLRKTRSKDDKNKLLGAYDPPNGGFTDEHHFRYCTGCTSKHIEPHTFGEWHILHSPFTDKNGVSHKGTAYRRCTECGYEVQQQYAGKYPILTWVYNGSNANGYGGATIDGAVAADPGQKVTLNVKCAEGCTYDRGHVDVSGYHNGWSLYEVTSQEGIEMQGKWIAYQNYELENFTADVFGTATFTMPDGPVALLFMVHDCDHKGYGTYADYIEPSCTGYGGDVLRCSECDKILEETKRVDPVGHQMVHDSTIQDGDCYHKSIEHHTCSKCGKEKKQAGEYHHDWVSLDNAYPNSCKSAGKETDWKCSLCGEIRYGERINPYGVHDFSEWETLIPATTRQKGLVVHECERCGQIEMHKTDYSGKDYRIAAQTSKINFSFNFGEEPEEQIVSIQSVGRDPVTVLLGATAKTTQYYTVKVLDDMRVSIKPNPVGIAMNGRASKDDVIEVMSASPGENGELATAMIAVSSQITYPSEKIHVSAEGAKISVYDETLKDFESRLRSSADLSAGTILKITADNPESFKRWIAKDASGMVPALLRDFLMVDESTAYLAVPPCDLTLTAADSTLRSLNYTMDIPEANEKILSDDSQMGGPDGYEDTLNGVLQWKTVLENGSYGDLTADCEAGKIYTLVCATDCGSDYEWEQDSDGNLLTKITLNGASPVKPVIRDGNAVLAEFAVMPQLAEKSVLLPGESCDISYPEKANGSDVKILGFEKCSGLSNLTLTDDGVGNIHITVPKNAVKGDYLYHVRMQIGDAEVVSAVPVTVSQTVQVRFDANGGFGTMEPDTAVLGRLYTLPACKFTAGSGLEFDCWNLGCPGDRIIVTEDVVLKAQWKQHVHNGRLIPASEPTCLLPGNVEYYYCEGCGKMFSDAECAMEAPTIDFFFIPATGHQMTLVPEKAASCAENGNKAYYICDNCGEWFADEAGIEPIGDHTAVLTAKLGHDWGKAVYSWSKDNSKVTAKRVCKTDASHVEEETADTVKTVQDPTCETAGSITYTAKFTNAAFAEQKKVIEIPKLTTTTTGITTTTTGKTTTTTGKTTTTTGKTTTTTTGITTTTTGKTTTTTSKTTTTTSKTTTTTTGKTTTTTGKTTTTTGKTTTTTGKTTTTTGKTTTTTGKTTTTTGKTTTTTGITTTTTGKTTTTTGKTTTTTGKTTMTTGKTTTTTGKTTTTTGKTTTTTGKTTTTTGKTTTTTGKTTTTTGKTTTTTVTTTTQSSQPLKGDYNNDNEVNIADAVLLARFLAEDTAMTDGQIDGVLHAEPDYDSDGLVTLFDVYALLKKLGAS